MLETTSPTHGEVLWQQASPTSASPNKDRLPRGTTATERQQYDPRTGRHVSNTGNNVKKGKTTAVVSPRKSRKSLAAQLVLNAVGEDKYKSHYEPQAPQVKPDVAWKF